jgi:ribosomal RNA-processing protein 9
VASVAACAGSDLAASGSGDGCVRLWRVGEGEFGIESRGGLPLRGYCNALALSRTGRFLLAGVGQEHRLGRWARDAGAKNGVMLHRLSLED